MAWIGQKTGGMSSKGTEIGTDISGRRTVILPRKSAGGDSGNGEQPPPTDCHRSGSSSTLYSGW